MKHERSEKVFKAPPTAGNPFGLPLLQSPASQSLLSMLFFLAACLLLIAVVADAAVQSLAASLDPSVKGMLRFFTRFGNSAWPLGVGLALLAVVELLRRTGEPARPEGLDMCRSLLILLVASVAISGVVSSLAKHMIGRIRPSAGPDAMVLDFSFMAFKSGWAAFPSGHATTATAAALALALCFPRQAWALLALGVLAALSRALLGVHWLTDCLAGIGLGAVVTLLIYRRMVTAGHHFDIPDGTWSGIAASLHRLAKAAVRRLS
ncbi:MAG: phosphatase PAP2 family protein [Paracoccaceae bacterium]